MPDPPGFADFYAAELHRLLLFLYKHGASWDEAWDAVQDAFLAALGCWDRIEHQSAWIRTTAVRSFLKQRLRPDEDLRRAGSVLDWLPRPKFADLDLDDQQRTVLDAIAALPPRQRQVMAWHYDGYAPAEIAAILMVSADAVRANLYQARTQLKRLLASGEGGPA